MTLPQFLALSTLFAFSGLAHSGAYRCAQPNGETLYQQTPCAAQADEQAIRLDSAPRASDVQAAQQRAQDMIQQVNAPELPKPAATPEPSDSQPVLAEQSNQDHRECSDMRIIDFRSDYKSRVSGTVSGGVVTGNIISGGHLSGDVRTTACARVRFHLMGTGSRLSSNDKFRDELAQKFVATFADGSSKTGRSLKFLWSSYV
ncbi:hypothetical protein Thiowin_01293 [Thiorhodovibrio winogradskyi]|uniref:DUF4124 domain-containing protein n=1 Tax=Thiorhodovibrio winogradskyi TaxID=77007 RepID=A0ABZ0S5N4_9GAMM|nr:hypothetical protein [Thiorhodovibrio winogradskyi]